MPSKTGKTYSVTYPNDLTIDQSSGVGIDSTTRNIQDGLGQKTAGNLSDDVFLAQPQNDDTTGAMLVKNKGGSNILAVDTTNSDVKAGASQVNCLTLFKEMGLYEISPNAAGNHYPLIANTMMSDAESFTFDDDWGNATDPPTSLDLSGLTDPENAIAVYWYLEDNIELDVVRFMAITDTAATLNFHLFAYDLDVSTNLGDLSGGVVHANGTVDAFSQTIKTGTFTLDTPNISANKVVIGFVENQTNTSDFSVSFNIKYHII